MKPPTYLPNFLLQQFWKLALRSRFQLVAAKHRRETLTGELQHEKLDSLARLGPGFQTWKPRASAAVAALGGPILLCTRCALWVRDARLPKEPQKVA